MRTLIQKDVDTLVYVGAGSIKNNEIPKYKKAYLIEADSEICEILSREFKDDDSVTIINQLVDDDNKLSTYIKYSVDDYSGIGKPTQLHKIYPNLEIIYESNSISKKCSTILTEINVQWHENNLLIIDLPGISNRIIRELFETVALYKFKFFMCRLPLVPLFEDEDEIATVTGYINNNNFELIWQQNNLTEYKSLLFKRKELVERYLLSDEHNNHSSRRICEVEGRLKSLRDRNKVLMAERDNARKERDELKSKIISQESRFRTMETQMRLAENKTIESLNLIEDIRKESANHFAKSKEMEYQLSQCRFKLRYIESNIELIKKLQKKGTFNR